MKMGFVTLALLAAVVGTNHSQRMPPPAKPGLNGAARWAVEYKPGLKWNKIGTSLLSGDVEVGKVRYQLVFACLRAPWHGYKMMKIVVSSFDPLANYEMAQFGGPATIAASTGSFDVVPESTLRDANSMSVTMIASDRIMDVLWREPTLDVRFGDAIGRFAFAFDVASGRSKILDFTNSCK